MNLLIQFDDQNLRLAEVIGAALQAYGASLPEQAEPFERVPTVPEGEPETVTETTAALVIPVTSGQDPEPTGTDQDANGVPHDEAYCVGIKSKQLFKKDGTWKKGRGVAQSDYDKWYADKTGPGPAEPTEPEAVNTAEAFVKPAPPKPVSDGPKDAGSLMLWVSEQQAAGNLTQTDIEAAYAKTGLSVTDLFTGTPEELADRVVQLYVVLSQ